MLRFLEKRLNAITYPCAVIFKEKYSNEMYLARDREEFLDVCFEVYQRRMKDEWTADDLCVMHTEYETSAIPFSDEREQAYAFLEFRRDYEYEGYDIEPLLIANRV